MSGAAGRPDAVVPAESAAPATPRVRRLVLGLLALHAVTAFPFPWEPAASWFRVGSDWMILVAAGMISVLGARPRAVVAFALAAAFLAAPLYRFGATAVPHFLGKPFEPWNDVLLLEGLDHLLSHDLPGWARAPALAGGAVVVAGVFVLLFLLVRLVLRAAAPGRRAEGVLALLAVLVLAGWAERSFRPAEEPSRWFRSGALGRAALDFGAMFRSRAWRVREAFEEDAAAVREEMARTPRDLERLRGADVAFLWVESYGRAAFRGLKGEAFAAWLAALATGTEAAGWTSASAFAYPSIRGGSSSLAHVELLCGVPTANRRVFDLAVGSGLEPLTRVLAGAGWRVVNAQPVMPVPWPEGDRFFGFAASRFQADFPYPGPKYAWGLMPDQYALGHLLRTDLADPAAPVCLHFVGVSSHAPFAAVPPYRPEWDGLDEPGAWAPERVRAIDWLNYAGHPEVEDAYLDLVRYELLTMTGFARRLRRPSFLVVLGDHQPPAVGALTAEDHTRDVPVHLLTNRPELLEPFLAQGFARGLVPLADQPSWSFTRFPFRFLRAFSGRPEAGR